MAQLTTMEAATRLGKRPESLTSMARLRHIKAVKVPYPSKYGFRWMFDADAVEKAKGNGHAVETGGLRTKLDTIERKLDTILQFLETSL